MAKKASFKVEPEDDLEIAQPATTPEPPRGLSADVIIDEVAFMPNNAANTANANANAENNTANAEVCPPVAFKPCRRISLRQARELHARRD